MKILLKNATIIDSKSPFNFSKKDILLNNGLIQSISENIIDNDAQKIVKDNLHVSLGWFDPSVCFGEPGFEERETIENGLRTAGLSGFTRIGLNPNTNPVIDNIAGVKNLIQSSIHSPTKIHPIATFSKKQKGEELAELNDLNRNGAIGFFDYKKSIINSNLLKIGLQYSQKFNGIIFSYPFDRQFGLNGLINEGITSTRLGLKGIPKLSEIIQIKRVIEILKYAGGNLLIPFLSTKESVDLIRKAKKNGLSIFSTVSIMHLLFSDSLIEDFDENFKFFPPLRTKEDSESLKKGLIDGTIDMVTSMHEPINKELKKLPFVDSSAGSIGLEVLFGVLGRLFPIEKTIQILTRGPKCFNLDSPEINEGYKANLTLFCPDTNWIFTSSSIKSKSKNCAFINQELCGKVYGVLNDNKLLIEE